MRAPWQPGYTPAPGAQPVSRTSPARLRIGKTDATFTLNFSTRSSMVLQYHTFIRFGHDSYADIMETMCSNARSLAQKIAGVGELSLIGAEEKQLPLVDFRPSLVFPNPEA